MPPKKIDEELDEDEDDEDEDDEDEDDEEDLEEMPAPKKNKKGQGRPKKASERKLHPVPSRPAQPEPQVRYAAFAQQAAEGIMDNETKEVIAADMWTALANIIERLERIENAIGVMQ